ncbi:hypothetical protein CK203_097047 [Vitis vinifera]|uniref:Uncharacterized protein n=1 Tax=Vitis vinifera TaxID=29760 RepID=A0A438E7L3_VITVI|nr:hypothetical protein CK203_097047 [Vitis vinifera]
MDVSLESKSLPSVGNSIKSYLQVTSQKLERGKLVHLHGRRSLALPSVGSSELKIYFLLIQKVVSKNKLLRSDYIMILYEASGEHCGTVQNGCEIFAAKGQHFRSQRLISQPCNILPSAWSDLLAMAVTPSFQLRIVHRLKHWIVDFLSFETKYGMHKLDFRKCSKSG